MTPLTDPRRTSPDDPPLGYLLVEVLAVVAFFATLGALVYAPLVGALVLGATLGATGTWAVFERRSTRSGSAGRSRSRRSGRSTVE